MTRRADAETWARDILGHAFRDANLLRAALAHGGAGTGGEAFQRLEFLGDRVLALAVADLLHAAFPAEREGDLARRHATLVSRDGLAEVAAACGLDQVATLPDPGDPTAARARPVLMADTFEALLGALYLDGGWDAARRAVERHWRPLALRAAEPPRDAKTRLQEWAQARGAGLPRYQTRRGEGPDHAPAFVAEVEVAGTSAAAAGPSKREAERAAATALLERVAP